MMPEDIQKMSYDELELEYSLLWDMLNVRDHSMIEGYDRLYERMWYLVYEMGLRETPLALYHYMVEDERLYDEDNWSVNWDKRTFKRITESVDKEVGKVLPFETFKKNCLAGLYNDRYSNMRNHSYSEVFYFVYVIKVNGHYIDVHSTTLNCVPTADAVVKGCVRTDFQYVRVYKR